MSRGTEGFANNIGSWLFMRMMESAAFIHCDAANAAGVKAASRRLKGRTLKSGKSRVERSLGTEVCTEIKPILVAQC